MHLIQVILDKAVLYTRPSLAVLFVAFTAMMPANMLAKLSADRAKQIAGLIVHRLYAGARIRECACASQNITFSIFVKHFFPLFSTRRGVPQDAEIGPILCCLHCLYTNKQCALATKAARHDNMKQTLK